MKNTFKTEKGHFVAKVTFDGAEIAKATDKAINRLVKDVTIKGFRKGMAPIDQAKRYLKNEDVLNATINKLLGEIDGAFEKEEKFQKVIKDNKLADGFRPMVNVDKFTNDTAEFTIKYVLRPTVSKLGEISSLKIDVEKEEIDDAKIEHELHHLAEDNAELVSVEREAQMGDTANIDFVGLMNGKEFDGGSAKGFDLVLGSGKFVPGFEEQIITHKVGDKFDVSLTMPENYPAPLTGKAVVFKVTINDLKEKQIPAIDDEFATTLSGTYSSENLADLKKKVAEKLEKDAAEKFKNEKIKAYINQIRDNSNFVIATEILDSAVKSRIAEETKAIEGQGLTLDQFLTLMNITKEKYETEIRGVVETELKTSMVYNAIVTEAKVAVPTKADVEAQIGSTIEEFTKNYANYLKASKMSDDQINMQLNNYINQIYSSILTARVQAKIIELNEGVENKADEKVEEPVEAVAEEEKNDKE